MGTTPGGAPQHFPGFEVVDQAQSWDPRTVRVVLGRLTPPEAHFFTPEEAGTARALIDRLLAQDGEPRVPVFELIDSRLDQRAGDGYRYVDLPEDPEAWRLSIANLDADAHSRYGSAFPRLDQTQQRRLIEDVRQIDGLWHGLPASRVFSLWMRYACSAFYSHPWAWNEIGFGGPAYPRGYKNLGLDRREPWEVREEDSTDPVPWAERAEQARRRHSGSIAAARADQDDQAEGMQP